jgi:hypothetical protein
VTLSGPPEGTQILTGRVDAVTFSGTVDPADVGARVVLQRQSALTGDEWREIGLGRVQAGGAFTIVHAFKVPGDANIRVLVRSQGRNVPSPSNVLTYDISQAENPELTIAASADPIVFGQSVTISGTLAGGAGKPVTLLAHTANQHGFAQVAQATTDGSGNYAFPAQAPVNSTYYEVQAADRSIPSCPRVAACKGPILKSAVLYEGVRDVLSAQVSATSILEGQTLTFTGSVAPSHPGHVIYLQRQSTVDHEFQVVQVGIISPESTFSVAHQVFSTGTQVFRVYVPGDPENAGAASQLFTVQVTPAPAATLMAEAPGNTSGPAEGSTSPSEVEKVEKEEERGAAESERESPHGAHHHR